MATTSLEVDTIKDYLISVGCKIEYPILVNAFKKYLYNADPAVQGKVRTQFKDYVNRLATVSLENNMKFIVLRPEFRPPEGNLIKHEQKQDSMRQAKQVSSVPTQRDKTGATFVPQGRGDQRSRLDSIEPESSRSDSQHQQMRRYQQDQHQIQAPKLTPQNHDQMDSARLSPTHSQQRHFHFPPNQLPSSMQEMQSVPRQPVRPPFPQANSNSSNKSRDLINAYHPERTIGQVPYVNSSPPTSEKSLPPTPQYHSRTQSQPAPNRDHFHEQQQFASQHNQIVDSPLAVVNNNSVNSHLHDDSAFLMPPPPPPHNNVSNHQYKSSPIRNLHQPASSRRQDTPTIQRTPSTISQQVPPPKPPPRRRQSTASLFKPSPTKPIEKISRDSSQDRTRKSLVGRVRDHASRFNSSASASDISSLMPKRNSSMKENRLSRESVFSGLATGLQRNGSQTRSRSSHRGEDESDSSSLQPIDPLRRKWAIEASSCNYNNLISLLREDPKLASCKDIVNGYTALHWSAKFGNLDIIKLIAGSYHVSADTKSSGGHSPLHVAYMFKRFEAARLLTESYQASENVRDHSGKKPKYYLQSS